jgi:hypothetical protein
VPGCIRKAKMIVSNSIPKKRFVVRIKINFY